MCRFPHGGDVLGASPANPLLAPVLRPAKALSLQQALLDLQAIQRIPGLAGYWPADPAYLFEDSAGTIPASVSGVVGAWNPANLTYSLSSEKNTSPATWTVQTEVTNTGGGSYTFGATTAIRAAYYVPGGNVPVNTMIRVAFTISGYVAGSAYAYSRGVGVSPVSDNGDYVFEFVTGTAGDGNFYVYATSGSTLTVSNISVKVVTSNKATQATTANKPYLRRTPTSGVYWLDSNTSTSALTATLGALGSACTVARVGAEGVTFTEGVTISSTYNVAPAYGFNGDVAVFNRALTVTEKGLLTRYMQRGVPVLGNELIANSDFNSASGWVAQTGWTITGGVARATNISGAQVYQSVGTAGRCYLITTVCNSFTSGKFRVVTNNSIYGSDRDAVGTYKDTLSTIGATIGVTSRFTGNNYDIDSFSVKELI